MARTLSLAAFSCAIALLLALPASAADPSGPCAPDAKRLCADVAPGHGAIMRCLSGKKQELSPECRARIDEVRSKRQERAEAVHAACGADTEKLCPGLEAGTGLLKCLYEHEADVSQPCRDKMRERGPEE